MAVEQRVSRRGITWKPKRSQVIEAGRFVRAGLPIHARWLPFLPPRLRVKARLIAEPSLAASTDEGVRPFEPVGQ